MMFRAAVVVLALMAMASGVEPATALSVTADPEAATHFFQNVRKLCGQRFEGATEFPKDEPGHPLAGKKLTISVEQCSDNEIRIPLQAGEDKSRTWILTLRDGRLLLKHDHRHADGTPDKVTMYGGWSTEGDADRQRFPADIETAKLIPEAATNIWTLEIDAAQEQLVYALERHGQPRYKAVFSLKALAR
jgi:hypothetical protein